MTLSEYLTRMHEFLDGLMKLSQETGIGMALGVKRAYSSSKSGPDGGPGSSRPADLVLEVRKHKLEGIVAKRAVGTALALAKNCEYQLLFGRDLYCSAAGSADETVAGSDGLRRLAPTSRAICAGCDMPDADFVCSHLAHPQVLGIQTMNEPVSRQLMGAFCEMGRPEIGQPSRCHAGGHPCWTRITEPVPVSSPAVPFSPRDLPVALDFLDAIWKQAFARPLIRLRSVEKTAPLSLPCATEEELRSRLGDLNELLKLMDISEEILPEEKRGQIDKQQTFSRMTACLDAKIQDEAEPESVSEAMSDRTLVRAPAAFNRIRSHDSP